jgi:hypothetical protein
MSAALTSASVARRPLHRSLQKAKRGICANHLIPAFGHLRLDAITSEDIQRLKLALADQSRTAS